MMNFVNKIELNYQRQKNSGNQIDENYKRKFLFTVKDSVLFGKYRQSMYFMSTIFLKDNIDAVRVPQFQLAYIRNTNHTSHKRG